MLDLNSEFKQDDSHMIVTYEKKTLAKIIYSGFKSHGFGQPYHNQAQFEALLTCS